MNPSTDTCTGSDWIAIYCTAITSFGHRRKNCNRLLLLMDFGQNNHDDGKLVELLDRSSTLQPTSRLSLATTRPINNSTGVLTTTDNSINATTRLEVAAAKQPSSQLTQYACFHHRATQSSQQLAKETPFPPSFSTHSFLYPPFGSYFVFFFVIGRSHVHKYRRQSPKSD